MSNELELISQGAGTRYAVIRRHSDYKVWGVMNAAWATYSAGSIGDYDVALTARGGDLWQADFPAAIAAGTRVRIVYYKQAGAGPSDTADLILAGRDVTWNGTTTEAGGDVTLSAYALTTLASVKRFLRITSSGDDTLLTELINAVTARMEQIAGCQFMARDYREWLSGHGENYLIVKHRPLNMLYRLAGGRETAITITATGFARATIGLNATGCTLYSVSTAGVATKTSLTFATYPSSGLLATAIDAVSGWTATKLIDCPTLDLHPMTAGCLDTPADLTWPDGDTAVSHTDPAAGIIYLKTSADWPVDGGKVRTHAGNINYLAEYNGGQETVNADLSMLCNELVADLYNQGKKDMTVRSESLGDWSYSLATGLELSDGQIQRLMRWSEIAMGGGR